MSPLGRAPRRRVVRSTVRHLSSGKPLDRDDAGTANRFGALPWATKLDCHVTSLAIVVRDQ